MNRCALDPGALPRCSDHYAALPNRDAFRASPWIFPRRGEYRRLWRNTIAWCSVGQHL